MTRDRFVVWGVAVGICCLTGSCFDPGGDRAERDQKVGQASAPNLRVTVEAGLAAVRNLSGQEITLWSSAPGFRAQLESARSSAEPWLLQVQNCLPDAELRLTGPMGEALPIEALETALPTRKTWRVQLPAGRSELVLRAPDADDREAWSFALLSDVQEAIVRVQDVFRRINAEWQVRFLLGAGDLTRRGGAAELERFQRELESLRVPYYTTLGNHELGEEPTLYHDYFGRGNSHFEYRGVAFTLVDSASATLDALAGRWLETWLGASQKSVHIVAMHIPPVDPVGVRNGSFASRDEAASLLVRLARAQVDLTVYGHIHSYYAFDNAGIPAYISGGGGAIPERFDSMGRHFMVFTVQADQGVRNARVVRVDPAD